MSADSEKPGHGIGSRLRLPPVPWNSHVHNLGSMVAWRELSARWGYIGDMPSLYLIMCLCAALASLRQDLFSSERASGMRLPAGPKWALTLSLSGLLVTWDPMEDRALLWTGMFNADHRAALVSCTRGLPLSSSRANLLGRSHLMNRAVRSLWETFISPFLTCPLSRRPRWIRPYPPWSTRGIPLTQLTPSVTQGIRSWHLLALAYP